MLRTSIDKIRENGFKLTKKRSRRYFAKTITDADYADDIAFLANTPNQAETLLHSFGQSRRRHWPPSQFTQNWIYVLQPNRWHFHTRRNLSETSRQIYLPRKQRLINRKIHRHVTNESMPGFELVSQCPLHHGHLHKILLSNFPIHAFYNANNMSLFWYFSPSFSCPNNIKISLPTW